MKRTILQLWYMYKNWKLVKNAFIVLLETNIYMRSMDYKIEYNWLSGIICTKGNTLVDIVLNLNSLELRITLTGGQMIKSYAYTHTYNNCKNRFEEIKLV